MAKKKSRPGPSSEEAQASRERALEGEEPRSEEAAGTESLSHASAERRRARQRTRMRRRLQQAARRTFLAAVLVSLFALPLAQLERAREQGKGLIELGTPRMTSTAVAALPGADALGASASGSVWSIALGGLEVADPLATAIVAAGTHGALLLTAALIPLLLTLLLGRVFCGWICPARLPVELAGWFRRRTNRRFALSLAWLRWVKYGVLAVGLLLVAAVGWNLLPLIFPPAIMEREALYLLCYGVLGWGAVFVLGAFIADLVVDRGAWCRGFCPGGALYSLLGRFAPLRVQVDEDLCVSCGQCREICPLGLDPDLGSTQECDRCGLCQTACKSNALTYQIRVPGGRGGGKRDA